MKKTLKTTCIASLLFLMMLSSSMKMTVNGISTTNLQEYPSKAQKTIDLSNTLGTSNPLVIEWNKTYGEDSQEILGWAIQTTDGGYALAGTTEDSNRAPRYSLLIKTDANGNVQWGGTYEEANQIRSLIQTADGGYTLISTVCTTSSMVPLFIKTDSNGNKQWSKICEQELFLNHALQTTDGGYALAGIKYDYNGKGIGCLVKTDSNGNQQWSKTYEEEKGNEISCVTKTTDGGYALAGKKYNQNGFAWLIKTDANGNMQWNKMYGGGESDWISFVIQTTDGGYALTGSTHTGVYFGSDFWLIKTDANGNMQWNKTYGGSGAGSIIQTTDGGYLMTGTTESDYSHGIYRDMLLVKTDSDGNEKWTQIYGKRWDEDGPTNTIQTNEGGYTLAGTVDKDMLYQSNNDFCLVKFASESIQRTELKLSILDGNKWHNAQVPFDIDGAEDYIDNFEKNGKPQLNFSTIPLNIEIQNVGNAAAENVVYDCTVGGTVAMVHLSGESVSKDKKVVYSFDPYPVSKTIGRIDRGQPQSVKIDIPMKYMCIIAGKLVLDKGNEWYDPYYLDVLFTIVELDIQLKVSSTNCQQVEGQTKIFAVGNPNKLLDTMIDALKERVEQDKIEALKQLLEMHIGVLASGIKSTDYSFGIGLHRITQPLDPKTSGINVGVIIPVSMTLIGLTVKITELASGLTSTLGISSSAILGFAMIVFPDVYKLLPRGLLSAEITLETQQVTTTGFALVTQQNSNASLTVTEIITPDIFEVSWKGNNYHVSVATNATITNFEFLDSSTAIRFNVTVANGTFYKIAVPNIFSDDIEVWCDDNRINFSLSQNATHSFIYFEYQQFVKSSYEITIVPEYTPLMVLLLLMMISTMIIALRKKTKRFL